MSILNCLYGKNRRFVDDKILKEFCDKSKIYWNKAIEYNRKPEYIFVTNLVYAKFAHVMPRLIYAKGLQDQTKLNVIILDDQYSKKKDDFYRSFGFSVEFFRKNLIKNPSILVEGLVNTVRFIIGDNSGEKLLALKYKNIEIGEYFYDHIIRTDEGRGTVGKLSNVGDWKKLLFLFLFTVYSYKQLKKYPSKYYICEDMCYFEGIPLKIAASFGSKIIRVTFLGRINELDSGSKSVLYDHDFLRKKIIEFMSNNSMDGYEEFMDKYFEKRFSGVGDLDANNAFGNKMNLSRQMFLHELDIDNGKKNVVILSHCFADWVHCGSRLLYLDYYDWLKETLKLAAGIKNVNWLVKAHPSRLMFGEKNEVRELVESFNISNIIYFPDDYSAAIIKDVADVIITARGTAGQEFSCYGIPIVMAGSACYSGFGFTIEPNNLKEYKSVLENSYAISKLNEEQKIMAKKVLYSRLQVLDYHLFDWFDEMIEEVYKNFDSTEVGIFNSNSLLLKKMCELYIGDALYNTIFYKRGNSYAKVDDINQPNKTDDCYETKALG